MFLFKNLINCWSAKTATDCKYIKIDNKYVSGVWTPPQCRGEPTPFTEKQCKEIYRIHGDWTPGYCSER